MLVARGHEKAEFVLTSGGAGGKVDASRIKYADIAFAGGDSLIAAMRNKLRREYGFPKVTAGEKPKAFGIGAVYSDEPVRTSQDEGEGFGVFVAVTASFGMRLAQVCVAHLLEKAKHND